MEKEIVNKNRTEEEFKLLSSVVEQFPEAMAVADLEGNLLFVNPSWAQMHGYQSHKKLVSQHLKIFHDKKQLQEDVIPFNKSVMEKGFDTGEVGHIRTDGTPFSTLMTATLLKDTQGKPIAIAGIAKDITELKQTQEVLQRAHDELERRVEERTAELVVANKQLRAEIEERKQAEDTLRESEEKWRSLVENAPGFIITVNCDGKIQFINRGVPGINAKEAIGESVYKYIEPEYRNTARETIKQVFETGEPSSYIVKGIGPDGHHILWYETQVGPIRHDSRVVAAILITTDISDHKQAQEALRQSEEKYKTLTENSLTGIYIHQDGKCVFVNNRFAQIHGYKPEELLGEHYLTLIHPDERTRVKQIGSKRLNGEPAPKHYEARRLRKDGEAVWCATIAVRIEYRGKPAIMGNIVDINEHKRVEEALRESEGRFREMADLLPTVVSELDMDFNLTYMNQAAFETFGYSQEDFEAGLNMIDMIRPDDRKKALRNMKKVIKEKKLDGNEYRMVRKDGSELTVLIHYRPIYKNRRVVGIRSTLTDITNRKIVEQALREREKELEVKTTSLEQANTALKVLLKRRHEDKTELEEKVLSNVKELVFPFLEKIRKSQLDPRQLAYMDILELNLNDIISPFLRNLSAKYVNLTPREIQVASLVKEGKTTKEIAELVISTTDAIDFHRKNLRKKLGLKNTKSNLRSYLLYLQ